VKKIVSRKRLLHILIIFEKGDRFLEESCVRLTVGSRRDAAQSVEVSAEMALVRKSGLIRHLDERFSLQDPFFRFHDAKPDLVGMGRQTHLETKMAGEMKGAHTGNLSKFRQGHGFGIMQVQIFPGPVDRFPDTGATSGGKQRKGDAAPGRLHGFRQGTLAFESGGRKAPNVPETEKNAKVSRRKDRRKERLGNPLRSQGSRRISQGTRRKIQDHKPSRPFPGSGIGRSMNLSRMDHRDAPGGNLMSGATIPVSPRKIETEAYLVFPMEMPLRLFGRSGRIFVGLQQDLGDCPGFYRH
jgi:hypothetical protein